MKHWTLTNGYTIDLILSGRSNVYALRTPHVIMLIDTGIQNHRKKLMQNLKLLGITRVDWLLLTHTHFDHCQNAAFLKKYFNCSIIARSKAVKWAESGYTKLPKGTFLLTQLISGIGNALNLRLTKFHPFAIDIPITGQDSLPDWSLAIEMIKTTGHSDDSISIVVNNEIAIVGDTLFGILRNSIFPPFVDNPNQLLDSWSLLSKSNCQVFLPGHGRPIHIELLRSQIVKQSQR
jgi:glyoxylase-like metal-dependent hydrolase (beta-lactamase superfamily II)